MLELAHDDSLLQELHLAHGVSAGQRLDGHFTSHSLCILPDTPAHKTEVTGPQGASDPLNMGKLEGSEATSNYHLHHHHAHEHVDI